MRVPAVEAFPGPFAINEGGVYTWRMTTRTWDWTWMHQKTGMRIYQKTGKEGKIYIVLSKGLIKGFLCKVGMIRVETLRGTFRRAGRCIRWSLHLSPPYQPLSPRETPPIAARRPRPKGHFLKISRK